MIAQPPVIRLALQELFDGTAQPGGIHGVSAEVETFARTMTQQLRTITPQINPRHSLPKSCGRLSEDDATRNMINRLELPSFLHSALANRLPVHYVRPIEFRPNDLALPRVTRRTDDLNPNLENKPGCATARPICIRN
jgi:hypothetical protein